MSQFWVVGVPTKPDDVIASRNQFLDSVSNNSESKPFDVPKYLQVGPFDKFFSLSEDLGKVDPQLGSLCRKLKRSYDEIMQNEPCATYQAYLQEQKELKDNKGKSKKPEAVKKPLYVSPGNAFDTGDSQGRLPKDFLQSFRWSEIAYGSSNSIEKIKSEILSTFARTEDELKHAMGQYNEQKNNVVNYEKKVNGNLLVRPISQFVNPKDIVFTQHLTTVVIAVPRAKEDEFLQNYEQIEFRYFERQRAEEEKRRAADEKDRLAKEAKEAELGKQSAAEVKKPAAPTPTPAPEEETELPPSDDDIHKAQQQAVEAAAQPAKPEIKIKLLPHKEFGLTSDDRYKFVPTIVPGSALKLVGAEQAPSDDLTLFRIICFKRYTEDELKQLDQVKEIIKSGGTITSQQQQTLHSCANVEKLKSICRDYRWTVRPFVYDPKEQEVLAQEIQSYITQRRTDWERLKTFCEEVFDSAFRAWIHLIAMRVFVENRLRYGLDSEVLAFVVYPKKNQEKKLRDILAKLYTEKGTESLIGVSDDGEYYPYVSINVDLTDML